MFVTSQGAIITQYKALHKTFNLSDIDTHNQDETIDAMDAVAAGWGIDQSLGPWLEKNVNLTYDDISDFNHFISINNITKRSGNSNSL